MSKVDGNTFVVWLFTSALALSLYDGKFDSELGLSFKLLMFLP